MRPSQKKKRITKFPPEKNWDWIGEISEAACPSEHWEEEANRLTVNRQIRSVWNTWLVFTCLERLRTTLTSLNLHEGCTYLSDPRRGLGVGESVCECQAFLTDAYKCSTIQKPECCDCSYTDAGYKLWLYPVPRQDCDCPHRQVGPQGWREVLNCRSQVCGNALDFSLKINTWNLTGSWSTLTKQSTLLGIPRL